MIKVVFVGPIEYLLRLILSLIKHVAQENLFQDSFLCIPDSFCFIQSLLIL
jgi:hypothetical protein